MIDRSNINIKLGLNTPPIRDFRNIPLRAILRLKELPPIPAEHNVNDAVGGLVDERMFANDRYGCCVISSQAHKTLRFEKFEQDKLLYITDQEVIDEYLRQTGGADNGLYLTLAMKEWRNTGWTAAGKKYNIYAYASVDPLDHMQVKYSIYLLNGITFGMNVYQTDLTQFHMGEPWHLTGNDGAFKGGHGVYAFRYYDGDGISFLSPDHEDTSQPEMGYARLPLMTKVLSWNDKGLWCNTWGVEQFMTWEFWDARVNQAFAVVDNRNKWQGDNSPVNVVKLDGYLREITGTPPNGSGCPCPCIGKFVHRVARRLSY